ncbi:hypothetical protein [Actinacidiphila oryziradicis]|uniref:Uncharacterized protein n=1 Tax=Actinacidiphila oryziradicis TaxID=2571141 RepID=A0A4U0S9M7_9ACTN|nr:hypothetical protein [Actinacidiphila oryziradicis]MCW2871264.1 hypothetical protein [Actinacidiphila oryziradicis]TJZ97024.1 hypothetical protein FCI23_50285 [Actinacidiphila oryziradicis]
MSATAAEPYTFNGTTWDDLRHAVEHNGGVLRIYMATLRELQQAGRLGINVRNDISRRLAGLGLGHLPAELPSYQENEVVLYQLGTAAADVVEAVRGDNFRRAENALRRLNTKGDAEKLAAIAAIIAGE